MGGENNENPETESQFVFGSEDDDLVLHTRQSVENLLITQHDLESNVNI